MSDNPNAVDGIFCRAIEIESADQRAAFVDRACAGDAERKARVEQLLDAHFRAGSFMERPKPSAEEVSPTADMPGISERPGMIIGRYKLLQQIGEGGMGVVFMAEQVEPVRRKVALKVIKPGMDTRQVVARFEAERQALALMDYPNIARVLDAGTTESGRPYFVMELVRGAPITEYCDQNKLSIRQRLDLFIDVCLAIKHAHQKGIIHRDIKPTNVLVTEQDGRAVPKVIDFGVAKALGQQLTEKTLFTSFQAIVGTPLYMSPEQAALSAVDVDTRSDVYSLGVLLYELLTGSTPFDKQRFAQAAYDEIRRVIQEQEPPKPSTRISTLGQTAATVSACRQTEPGQLTRSLRGDLDWIVMKAMEKDRGRRYETASDLAADVKNYLDHEPVTACPPTMIYRLRKFARRNKSLTLGALAVAFVLLLGIASTSTMTVFALRKAKEAVGSAEEAVRNAKEAEKERQVAKRALARLRGALFEQCLLLALAGDKIDDRLVNDMRLSGVSEDWIETLQGVSLLHSGEGDAAVRLLEQTHTDNVAAQALLAQAYLQRDEWIKFEKLSVKLQRVKPRPEYEDLDEFFLTYAGIGQSNEELFERMDAVLRRHPSWIVPKGLRALIGASLSYYPGNAARLDSSLQDARALAVLYPDNPFLKTCHLNVLLWAIEHDNRQGRQNEALRHEAANAADKLSNYPLATRVRPVAYDFAGQREKAKAAWLETARNGHSLLAFEAAGFLYREKYEKDAWSVSTERLAEAPATRAAKAYMLAGTVDGRDEALRIYDSLVTEEQTWSVRQMASKILLLLGETERVRQDCDKWIKQSRDGDDPHDYIKVDKDSIRYLAQESPRGAFPCPPNTPLRRFYIHYTLACECIGADDRKGAIRHLTECVKNGSFDAAEANWAAAFLRKLETDPQWPQAHRSRLIPAKK